MQARSQAGAMGAIAPSAGSLHPLALLFAPVYLGYRSSTSLLPCHVDFNVNDFAPFGILAWLRVRRYETLKTILKNIGVQSK